LIRRITFRYILCGEYQVRKQGIISRKVNVSLVLNLYKNYLRLNSFLSVWQDWLKIIGGCVVHSYSGPFSFNFIYKFMLPPFLHLHANSSHPSFFYKQKFFTRNFFHTLFSIDNWLITYVKKNWNNSPIMPLCLNGVSATSQMVRITQLLPSCPFLLY
jgi:hypothetical protein